MSNYESRTIIDALSQIVPSELSVQAHELLFPYSDKRVYSDIPVPSNAIECAVIILFYEGKDGNLCFCLIRRTEYDGLHSGQMALPGGKYEATDKDLRHTAIREAFEEIGIELNNTTILSQLAQVYIPVSNSIITPFIGFYNAPISFTLSKKEVREIVEVNINDFLGQKMQVVKIDAKRTAIPAYVINGKKVWGATAMILADLQMSLSNALCSF